MKNFEKASSLTNMLSDTQLSLSTELDDCSVQLVPFEKTYVSLSALTFMFNYQHLFLWSSIAKRIPENKETALNLKE